MTTTQANPVTTIGVGIDTSRYGHYVSFLRDDLQPATEPLTMTETQEGLRQAPEHAAGTESALRQRQVSDSADAH